MPVFIGFQAYYISNLDSFLAKKSAGVTSACVSHVSFGIPDCL